MNDDIKFSDNEIANQYEVSIDGKLSKFEYIKTKTEIYLTHTEVDIEHEGNGI
jgi:predicted GNAT family acetyltransferase